MLLSLENEQSIYESNARFHICKNGFYMDFQTFSVVINDLPYNSNLNFIVDWDNWNS